MQKNNGILLITPLCSELVLVVIQVQLSSCKLAQIAGLLAAIIPCVIHCKVMVQPRLCMCTYILHICMTYSDYINTQFHMIPTTFL